MISPWIKRAIIRIISREPWIQERERRRVRVCLLGHNRHAQLSVICNTGKSRCRPLVGNETLRKSRLHKNEIYICEFCTHEIS